MKPFDVKTISVMTELALWTNVVSSTLRLNMSFDWHIRLMTTCDYKTSISLRSCISSRLFKADIFKDHIAKQHIMTG
jgi:hypothetical protein